MSWTAPHEYTGEESDTCDYVNRLTHVCHGASNDAGWSGPERNTL